MRRVFSASFSLSYSPNQVLLCDQKQTCFALHPEVKIDRNDLLHAGIAGGVPTQIRVGANLALFVYDNFHSKIAQFASGNHIFQKGVSYRAYSFHATRKFHVVHRLTIVNETPNQNVQLCGKMSNGSLECSVLGVGLHHFALSPIADDIITASVPNGVVAYLLQKTEDSSRESGLLSTMTNSSLCLPRSSCQWQFTQNEILPKKPNPDTRFLPSGGMLSMLIKTHDEMVNFEKYHALLDTGRNEDELREERVFSIPNDRKNNNIAKRRVVLFDINLILQFNSPFLSGLSVASTWPGYISMSIFLENPWDTFAALPVYHAQLPNSKTRINFIKPSYYVDRMSNWEHNVKVSVKHSPETDLLLLVNYQSSHDWERIYYLTNTTLRGWIFNDIPDPYQVHKHLGNIVIGNLEKLSVVEESALNWKRFDSRKKSVDTLRSFSSPFCLLTTARWEEFRNPQFGSINSLDAFLLQIVGSDWGLFKFMS